MVVLVDLEVLEARSDGSATLTSGTVVSGEAARRLAEEANITRVITKGRSEPLDVGRTTRSVPPAIAKAVIARDRHCRFDGCTAPPVGVRRPSSTTLGLGWADLCGQHGTALLVPP